MYVFGVALRPMDSDEGATARRTERRRRLLGYVALGATLMLGYLGVPLDETLDEDGYRRLLHISVNGIAAGLSS